MTERALNHYRATIRHGTQRKQYVVLDVEAASAADALRDVAERLDADVSFAADIVELRVLAAPDSREYGPE